MAKDYGEYDFGKPKFISPIPFKPELLTLNGISPRQIEEHFNVLYIGYVNKTNEIRKRLMTASRAEPSSTYSPYRCLKVEESYAFDGVKFHEYYFENLGGKYKRPDGLLERAIIDSFGSYQNWIEDFKALGLSMRGWAVLSFDYRDGGLHNYGLDAHNIGVITGSVPLLVLDVYEHAYFIDYGTRRAAYIEAFMENIDWEVVNRRFYEINFKY